MKIGVIDVGGGLRGVYGAGVFDYCMENEIHFDYCVGISAGSANISSYLAKQMGRNYIFYTDFSFRKEYMSIQNFIKDHNYVDLDYIYGALSNSDGEFPLDFLEAKRSNIPFVIVTTNALTGKAEYFHMSDMSLDHYDVIKASCSVPVVNKPYMINDIPYYDGGMSDPIPIIKCFEDGCDKVVLILTRPKDYERVATKDEIIAKLMENDYPNAARAMKNRAEKYNLELALCKEYEKLGKVKIIAPDDIGDMSTLTRDREEIKKLYAKGFLDAKEIMEFIKQ